MLVIVGLIVFLVAGLVAVVGMLGNAGAGHPPTENIAVFGYHPTGSTGTLFLLRIVVGVVASLGVTGPFVGAQRSASRAADARRAAARFRRERAFVNRYRDTRLEHQQRADASPGRRTARTSSVRQQGHAKCPSPVDIRHSGTDRPVASGSCLVSVGVGAHEPATPFAAPLSDHPIG